MAVLAAGLLAAVLLGVAAATPDTEQAKLTASDAAGGVLFGDSVAISGGTAVVDAYRDDDGGNQSGSAYVFVRSGGTWSEQTKLMASDAAADDYFGWSVAISGDTVVVGARLDNDGGPFSGSAYVFVRSSGSWSQQAKLTASDAAAEDQFGYSVAVSGDTAVVGNRGDADGGLDSGSAYVFVRSGTTWSQQAKLTASDAAADDFFGDSVAVSGDTAVVGAPWDDDAGLNSGSAYVFGLAPPPDGDSDGDGFDDDVEAFIGTDPFLACGAGAWPPDFNDDMRVNLLDVFAIRPVFGTASGDGTYLARFDLNASGNINLLDVFILRPYFGTECSPP